MKRFFCIFPLVVLCFTFGNQLFAQDELQPIPIDSKVRYGKLENGLTYFIRHNELPKQRAEFFIAQKVGSVLEEDNQAGLAHFLEHMAFNGTKNFPGKTMINYLETIGVKFGENLNAYTAFDETVYNISNVPVSREGIVDSCLLVLHDWSGFISLETDEISKERGVIREEMRTRNSASYRQIEKLLPIIMPGSQYAKRLPIGTEDVIMNFKPEDLRTYYHKWYRPDLQGIIVIGDIDVDQIEAKIKKMFADIPQPVNPAERIYYPVPDNQEPLVGIVQDKESTNSQVSVYYKYDPMPAQLKASTPGLVMNYMNMVLSKMLNDRFSELRESANPPFVYAGASDGDFIVAKTKDAWVVGAVAKENGIEEALKSITREVQRAKQSGFTPSEYERAKTNVLKWFENQYNERGKTNNARYAREYSSYFTDGGYIPGIEYEYRKMEEIAPHITVEYLNQYFGQLVQGDKNVVISLTCPEKEGVVYPAADQLLAWYNEAKGEKPEAYEDKTSNEPLIDVLPAGGKITKTTQDKVFGTTNYTLSNGVKVVIKQTDFKDDEIQMNASKPGGSSLFPENDFINQKMYGSLSNIGGLKNFSNVDLNKVLAGKKVSVYPFVSTRFEGMSGSSSPKDFETMLQLIYLHFTAPRTDDDAFRSFMERLRSQLENQEANPNVALADTFCYTLYQQPEKFSRIKISDLPSVDYHKIMNWRKERYKDADDFTFIFVGNIHPDEVKSLIAKYLGALPATNRKEKPKDVNLRYKQGKIVNAFNKEMQNPKTTVIDVYSGELQTTLVNRIQMDMLQQILRIVYTEKIREDEGGTYGVGVRGSIANYPAGQTSLQISFDTNADKKDMLNKIVHDELFSIAQRGPRPEDFNKVKEFMVKKQAENEQENGYWLGSIISYYEQGYNGYTEYLNTLQRISSEDIRNFTATLLNQKNMVELMMVGTPAK